MNLLENIMTTASDDFSQLVEGESLSLGGLYIQDNLAWFKKHVF